jgi:hypothetical protein
VSRGKKLSDALIFKVPTLCLYHYLKWKGLERRTSLRPIENEFLELAGIRRASSPFYVMA